MPRPSPVVVASSWRRSAVLEKFILEKEISANHGSLDRRARSARSSLLWAHALRYPLIRIRPVLARGGLPAPLVLRRQAVPIEPIKEFARMVEAHLGGRLAWHNSRSRNGLSEGKYSLI